MHIYDIRTLYNYFPTLWRQHQRPRDYYKPYPILSYSKCIFTTTDTPRDYYKPNPILSYSKLIFTTLRTLCNYFPTLLRQHQRPRDYYKPYPIVNAYLRHTVNAYLRPCALYATIFPHFCDNIKGQETITNAIL